MPTDPTQTHLARELKQGSPLLACRYAPSGRFVFAAAQDHAVHRFAVEGDEHVALAGHESWPQALAFDPAGKVLVSGGCDGRLIWWEAEAAAPTAVRTVEAHVGWVRAVAISADGHFVASGGNDNRVKIWSAADGSLVRELVGHESHVYSVLFDAGSSGLLSGDLKGIVRQWDLGTGAQVRRMDASALWKYDEGFRADIGGVRGMSLSADRTRLACAGITAVTNAFAGVGEPLAVVFDFTTGERRGVHKIKGIDRGVLWNVAYHPDGYLIGASGGGSGGFLAFWRDGEEAAFHQLKLVATCRDMALAPDGLHVATADHDGAMRVYALAKGD